MISFIMDFVLHADKHLAEIVSQFGVWTYFILFIIIFSETGFVITPFLPGDSLLFVVGALGASGTLDFKLCLILLIVAGIAGNSLNYYLGKTVGYNILNSNNIIVRKIVKREYLEKAHDFYVKHGGKAIMISRFLAILRTFAPFVAGIAKMDFLKFTFYNTMGALLWGSCFMVGGYFFGNIPTVRDNFSYVIMGIVAVTILPALIAVIKTWHDKRKAAKA